MIRPEFTCFLRAGMEVLKITRSIYPRSYGIAQRPLQNVQKGFDSLQKAMKAKAEKAIMSTVELQWCRTNGNKSPGDSSHLRRILTCRHLLRVTAPVSRRTHQRSFKRLSYIVDVYM